MDKIKILQDMIDKSHKIVFLGGAGVSTESGIPDFRGPNGIYKQKYKYDPEYLISIYCFNRQPKFSMNFTMKPFCPR